MTDSLCLPGTGLWGVQQLQQHFSNPKSHWVLLLCGWMPCTATWPGRIGRAGSGWVKAKIKNKVWVKTGKEQFWSEHL